MTVTPMTLRAFITTTALIACPIMAHAADITGDTRVSAVTVYADRASVTRTGTVTVTPGDHVVIIDGLPGGLSPDSLRADGSSTAGVTLGAVEHKIINAAQLSAPRERELRTKLQDLQDQRALIIADQTALNARVNFLNKIGDTASTRVNEDIKTSVTLKPDEWAAAAIKMSSTLADTQKSLQGIVVALRKLDDEINAVQNDLNGISNGGKQSVSVRIPLTATSDGTLTFNVEYQVYGASWRPLYDARLTTATNTLDMTQFGEVRQVTGEDWTNAKLTLSTAQPARGATPPDLYTQWVNVFNPQPEMMSASIGSMGAADGASFRAAPLAKNSAVMEFSADKPAAAPVAFQGAQIETGGYVASYHIPGTTTVTADNTAKKVMIQKLKTTTSLVAQARPALDPSVYLMAKVTLGGDNPLLPGPVNLFRDNAFIGSAMQTMLRPSEKTDLPFGIDDQVVMKRQTLTDKRGTSGVISAQSTLERLYDTEIQNLHKFDIALEILESTPVSQDERVKIMMDTKNTTPGFEDNAQKITGLKKWRFDKLTPNGKQNVKLGYTATWPKDLEVNGL